MSTLYIRKRTTTPEIVHNVSELRDFIADYIEGRKLLLDISLIYSGASRALLLKFLEDNPEVDCFSTTDILDPILLSRFRVIEKDPIPFHPCYDDDKFIEGKHTYENAYQYLTCSNAKKLLAVRVYNPDLLDILL